MGKLRNCDELIKSDIKAISESVAANGKNKSRGTDSIYGEI
jgi:hypothetical protein